MEDTVGEDGIVHHYKFNGGDVTCYDTHDGKFCGKKLHPDQSPREFYATNDGERFTITGVKK